MHRPRLRWRVVAALVVTLAQPAPSCVPLAARAYGGSGDAPDAGPTIALTEQLRREIAPLGAGVVGAALPAPPIEDPTRLYDLTPGEWDYEVVDGANAGQVQHVTLERTLATDEGATWRLTVGDQDIQQLKVTIEHRIVKTAQTDLKSDRLVVYRPGLVLTPGMRVGDSKTVRSQISTFKLKKPDRPEYDGDLSYTTTYVGVYRVSTPAGRFDARLLRHQYEMRIGPATATHESYGFYALGIGNVAEVSRESVKALLVYNRSTHAAKVLIALPHPER